MTSLESKRRSKPAFTRLGPLFLFGLPLLFLLVFFFNPLFAVFRLALQSGTSAGQNGWSLVLRPLGFTIGQALLSTLLTLLVGLPAAFMFARFDFPGKRLLQALTTLPFILPTVVVAAGFNALLGPRGWMNLGLMGIFNLETPPIQILNTLAAILLAHVFYNTTIVIRLVGSAWAQMDVRLEAAARTLGASPLQALREVTLPLLRPSILAATLLVFLFDFTSFGVILLLGGPHFSTLEVEIYVQALQMLNLPVASLLSAIQMACTLVLTLLYSRLAGNRDIPLAPHLHGEATRPARRWSERVMIGVLVVTMLLLLVSPLAALAARSFTRLDADRGVHATVAPTLTLDYYRELFINRQQSAFYVPPIEAVRNSLIYALVTTFISTVLGFVAAYALAKRTTSARILDAMLMLPLGASAVTLGLGFLLVFNRPPLDVRSLPVLIPIAHSLVALPFVVRTLLPAIAAIPPHLREAAAVLGASPWQVWRKIDLPILTRAVLVSAIFSFTISLGEFGATSFLARPEYPTIPLAIYRFLSQPGALNYGQALAMATLLMGVCALSVLLMQRLDHK